MWRLLCTAALLGASVTAQPAETKFEVASIKPGQRTFRDIKIDAARVDIPNWSLLQLITRAYGIWPHQVSGPNWIQNARFDIVATFPQGATRMQFPEMLRALLADRFGLVTHQETREMEAYALVVSKGGPKMKLAPPDSGPVQMPDTGRLLDAMYGSASDLGLKDFSAEGGDMHATFTKLPMAALAQMVSSWLGVPVIDRTGLKENYRATIEFSLADTAAAANMGASGTATDPPGTSLFAVIKHLGLALERVKAPIPVLVVDYVAQVPKEN